jgi:hypothetical protein
MENFLVVDADTIFLKDQIFEFENKFIFNISDEYHLPYFEFINSILEIKTSFPFSFVSHHMIFNVKILNELKSFIETKTNKIWYFGILSNINYNETSPFSEYETYAHYFYRYYKKNMIIEYWHNISFSRVDLNNISIFIKKFANSSLKTISFHSYNN